MKDLFEELIFFSEPEEEAVQAQATNIPDPEEEQEAARSEVKQLLENNGISYQSLECKIGHSVISCRILLQKGVRSKRITDLADDLALYRRAPVRATVGKDRACTLELPRAHRETVEFKELTESEEFRKSAPTSFVLGCDTHRRPVICDLRDLGHLLVAGATGMGKTVCINSILMSLLSKASPNEVQLVLIDPKRVELFSYREIPHLKSPILFNPKDAVNALQAAVTESEARYGKLQAAGVANLEGYNRLAEKDPNAERLPRIVIVIDELADLMISVREELEAAICQLVRTAHATGIHLIVSTQRPTVDVLTGLIKANIPSRIACTVTSQADSRAVMDAAGAERLLGRGDLLFVPVGAAAPIRVQGAYVDDREVERLCATLRKKQEANQLREPLFSTELLSPAPAVEGAADWEEAVTAVQAALEAQKVKAQSIECKSGRTVSSLRVIPLPGTKANAMLNAAKKLSAQWKHGPVRAFLKEASCVYELPNESPVPVSLRELLECEAMRAESPTLCAIGADANGDPLLCDLLKLPHLLVFGDAGTGKTSLLASIILSLCFRATPKELRLILGSSNANELSAFRGLPHLALPILHTPEDTEAALEGLVEEMERRFDLLKSKGARNLKNYNQANPEQAQPFLAVLLDEIPLNKKSEDALMRLAQKSRAAGISLILTAQGPDRLRSANSVMANLPSRLCFRLPTAAIAKRALTGESGAELLTGSGDALFCPVGALHPVRAQTPTVAPEDIERVCAALNRAMGDPQFLPIVKSK